MTDPTPTLEYVLSQLRENSEAVLNTVALHLVILGGKREWSMDNNFNCTEDIAGLAAHVALPHAGNQSEEDFKFWGTIALTLDLETDYVAPQYVATINTPGYLPMDDDPPVFEDEAEAWAYLANERKNSEDEAAGGDIEYSTTYEALVAMAEGDGGVATIVGPTPGYDGDHDLGLAYSVSIVEED
jgi:hypothetical protein